MIFLKKNWIGIVVWSVLLLILCNTIIKNNEQTNYLNGKKVLYTICNTTDYKSPGKGAPIIEYYFYYGKEKLISWDYYNINTSNLKKEGLKSYVGKKYFVKFSIERPEYSEIYLDKPVPKDFVYKEGQTWSKIPID